MMPRVMNGRFIAEAFMSSIDLLEQNTDRPDIRARCYQSLKRLLAEYRRAVAAEEFYDELRCGRGAAVEGRFPRSQIARSVFDRFYSAQ